MLNVDEANMVLNFMITAQLIRLLEKMWEKNCVVAPTSFKKVFSDARDKFFYGYAQHDAEEAYSCILQKMQEELGEEKNIKFKTEKLSVKEFLHFKNNITSQIESSSNLEEKKLLMESYIKKKKEMPAESLTVEAFREMKKYYGSSYSRITEIFTGFLHSSINCPEAGCNYSSNKFDPFTHLSLPLPKLKISVTIEECMNEYCKDEILDEENMWLCECCNKRVCGIKKLQLWTAPPVLVIQIKRFGAERLTKDNRMVLYPTDNFDISSIISKPQLDVIKCKTYKLQSVINHSGNMHSGHYYSYCLDEDTNQWYDFDDQQVTRIPNDTIVSNTAYLLVYIRRDLIKSDH